MALGRDPIDPEYRQRLAASTVASLVLHALFAALFFAVLMSSAQEGTTENVSGGEVVTLERRTPVVIPNQPAATRAAIPIPHAPRIAPLHHAPQVQPQAQRLPQNRHELAREAPTAPPNPKPLPQRQPQPNPQPTQNVYEVQPRTELPAAPLSIPTVAPVAVAVKAPPTAAPSPAPTAAPSARPSARPAPPTAVPSARPASPVPAHPSASPAPATVAARATAAPSVSPAPAARASVPPAERPGVPSPSPTNAAAVAKTSGTAPSPGPKGTGSPGPLAGQAQKVKAAPARPIEVRPTASPVPRPSASPTRAPVDINARLRAMLPNNPVNPTSKQYAPPVTLHGTLEPTPPPEVLAQTKYLYRTHGVSEGRIEMWVTSTRKVGPTTVCTGWLVRYPLAGTAPVPRVIEHATDIPPANGSQLSVGGHAGAAYLPPIVDGIVSMSCQGRLLEPYAASPAPSP